MAYVPLNGKEVKANAIRMRAPSDLTKRVEQMQINETGTTKKKTLFMDLPDDIIEGVIENVDYRTRLVLRKMNGRLNRIERGTKMFVQRMPISFNRNSTVTFSMDGQHEIIGILDANVFHNVLVNFPTRTYLKDVQFDFHEHYNKFEEAKRIVNAVSKFEINILHIRHREEIHAEIYDFQTLAQKARGIKLDAHAEWLSTADFSFLCKAINERNCKLELFSMDPSETNHQPVTILRECFGIIVDVHKIDSNPDPVLTWTFRVINEASKVYAAKPGKVYHFCVINGNVSVFINNYGIAMYKAERTEAFYDEYKMVQLDRAYAYEDSIYSVYLYDE